MNQSTQPPLPGFRKPRIMPPVWLVLALLAMFALDRWLPVAQLFGDVRRWLCWLLLAPGLGILAWAVAAFIRVRTGLVPFSESTALVTSGLYRLTRNPMYLGMVLVLAGAAVRFGSVSAWLPVPVFAWILHRNFIRHEERFLESIYGAEYLRYRDRVRRWL